MKYLIIRNFLSDKQCNLLRKSFESDNEEKNVLHLLDGEDKTNTIYKSKRSFNLSYKYVSDKTINQIQIIAKKKLSGMLGVSFEGSINDKCLPMFAYGNGGEIKAHRGVQKSKDISKYQSFVAVCQLTQRGVDFEDGRFYVNPKASASTNGKDVFNDFEKDRFYPNLNKGDVCLIYNPVLVHGVEKVSACDNGNSFRLTCSWRSNEEQ